MWWIIGTVVVVPLALFGAALAYEIFRKQPETTLPEYRPD